MVRAARRVVLVLSGVALLVLLLHQLSSRSAQLCTAATGAGAAPNPAAAPLKVSHPTSRVGRGEEGVGVVCQ